ncbi:MAG: hypothetical protein AABZ77_06495 [Chloroflexota bacterium]
MSHESGDNRSFTSSLEAERWAAVILNHQAGQFTQELDTYSYLYGLAGKPPGVY